MKQTGGILEDCLHWLAGQQLSNGSFEGLASPKVSPFIAEHKHANAFFTSLILVCLQDMQNAGITQRAIKFLKNQQSPIGSWNYWDRNSAVAQDYPFPDDLDDTAYTLLALSIYDPGYVDGALLAKLAKLLISNELKTGGPYRTWLVQPSLYKEWGDTDLAVNANIAGLLAHHGVKSPALETYAEQQIVEDKLSSRYYLGTVPSLYFLSRWHKSLNFKKTVAKEFRNLDDKSDMELAMLLTAGCRLGCTKASLKSAHDRLLDNVQTDHWLASALYIELTINKKLYYAGSEGLTTAFAAEALHLYQKQFTSSPLPVKPISNNTFDTVATASQDAPRQLRKSYLEAAKLINDSDSQRQIIGMSDLTAQAYDCEISQDTRMHLNAASLNGWIAYTIYDDFFDQEAGPQSLAIANYAMRQMIRDFRQALPQHEEFQNLASQTLDKMDAANSWEVLNARGEFKGGTLHYRLPAYGNFPKLAERSWGHMLSSLGSLIAKGLAIDSPEAANLQKFFHHYLIARQLNDDAHDWLDDLKRGHLSAVVVLLLKNYNSTGFINIEAAQKDLQLYFWQNTIIEAGNLIDKHIRSARQALKNCGMANPDIFGRWLDDLESATKQAVAGSQEARKFIDSYAQNQS